MMTKYSLLFWVGLALAVVTLFATGPTFRLEADRSAYVAAFPITERVASSVNLMLSQNEDGFVDVRLPPINCTVAFNDRMVSTTVYRGGTGATYWMFAYDEFASPDEIKCQDDDRTKTVVVHVQRIGENVIVTRELA